MVVDTHHALMPMWAGRVAWVPWQPYTQSETGLWHGPIPRVRRHFTAVDCIADDCRGVVAVGSGRVQGVAGPVGETLYVVGCRGSGNVDGGEAGVGQYAGTAGGTAAVTGAGTGDASICGAAGWSRSLARGERFRLEIRGVFGSGCSFEEGGCEGVGG